MKNKMKLKKIGMMILSAFMMLSTMVGCNSNIEDQVLQPATISFATSVPKALNQEGAAQEVSDGNVDHYHWRYQVTTDNANWNLVTTTYTDFDGKTNQTDGGLGQIKSLLIKGQSYYFKLAGFTTNTDEMVWEGETKEAVKLNSKNTLVSVSVKPVGKGSLYFNISAPAYDVENYNARTGNPDKFVYSIQTIGGTPVATNVELATKFTTTTELVSYNSVGGGNPNQILTAGTYILTIEQQTYRKDLNDTTSADPYKYMECDGRSQFLIFTIASAVDTVISGSLDSTTIEYFYNFDGFNDVAFQKGDNSKIKTLDVTVSSSKGESKIISNNERINVNADDYIDIKLTSTSDYTVYVNRDKVNFSSVTDLFHETENGKTLVKTHSSDNSVAEKTIRAYAKAENSYIVTIVQGEYSISFTIVGFGSESAVEAEAHLTSGTNVATNLTSVPGSSSEDVSSVSATVSASATNGIINNLYNLIPADLRDDSTKVYKLTLGVLETDKSEKSIALDISLSAFVEAEKGTTKFSTITDIENVPNSEYVELSVTIDKNLSLEKVYHGSALMGNDLNNPGDAGAYSYAPSTGVLTIKTKSFSPFKLEFVNTTVATIGYRQYKSLQKAVEAATADATNSSVKDELIVLTTNTNETIIIPSNLVVTIDLNGCELNGGNTDTIPTIKNFGTLTIKDSKNSGKVTRNDPEGSGGNTSDYVIDNQGVLTIKGGTFVNQSGTSDGHDGSSLIRNGEVKPATINIKGGVFYQKNFNVFKNGGNSVMNISGGTINCEKNYAIINYGTLNVTGGSVGGPVSTRGYKDSSENSSGSTVISGGSFNSVFYVEQYSMAADISTYYATNAPSLRINDGEFMFGTAFNIGAGNGALFFEKETCTNKNCGSITICGGVFNVDPTAYVDGASYNITKNAVADKWTVSAKKTYGD